MAEKPKKITKKKTAPRKSNGKLTAKDMEHFKDLLLEKRREIMHSVSEIGGEALGRSRQDASGDLSCMPLHMADLGTDNYEQEFALNLMDGERRLLHDIDEALNRIQEGTYGTCEGTGVPIGKPRLEARPWSRYCVDFARKVEEGLVEPPEH